MFIDWKNREIVFKIVYYGPGLGGKTTNLEYIHSKLNPSLCSELISFKTKEDRTLYFDFMQMGLPAIDGKKPRFHLYTIPGQVQYGYGRKLVISGADAIVFVADSQKARMDENLASLADLQEKLSIYKKSLQKVPWIMQYNKRDLPHCATIPSLQSKLNFMNVPYFEAVAMNGQGVFETLKKVIQITLSQK
ncbi:GTPase domain-containing protein [candidate division KSB1 bacterium]|nr:GTPase domain-containing protein [candidate division KSB1 bacterium]